MKRREISQKKGLWKERIGRKAFQVLSDVFAMILDDKAL